MEARRLGIRFDTTDRVTIRGYGGGNVISLGSANVKVTIDGVTACLRAVIVPDGIQSVPVLVGRTFTELPSIVMTKDDVSLRFDSKVPDVASIDVGQKKETKIVIRVAAPIVVLPDHVGLVRIMSNEHPGDVYIESQLRGPEGAEYCIPRVIVTLTADREAVLPLVNLSDRAITLHEAEIVARAWPCVAENEESEKVEHVQLTSEEALETLLDNVRVGPIGDAQRRQLHDLIWKYRDCFATTISELGCAKSAVMRIRLNEDKPFTYRPYKMARAEQEAVRDIVTDLLKNNIIRNSDSEYCSPILLVRKKNGEQRLCVDYRKLNAMTMKDNYPLPRIDDQIDRLQGGIYFTSLDLHSGYYQIPLDEQAKRYTSFITPMGQYEYNRMPFGLTNAPRVFQRFMNKLLLPAKDYAAVYLDDVLLHAQNIDAALENLEDILNLFRRERVTLNLQKCSFLMTSVTFLGYEIGKGEVRPGSEKVKAIQDFTAPESVHQVRQFLGLSGYFRHFVNNYAKIAQPMTALTKKEAPWRWTRKEKEAFETLKETLIKRPVLALFDSTLPTEVHCDASSLGLAGILLQLHPDGRLHPVAYYSRQTTESEQKFHSYELETLAVVESLKKFRTYLLGLTFTVVTDCNSLKATQSKKHILPRIARWWLQLQEFSFDVKYRPGERMRHVDALSRNPRASGQDVTEVVMHIEQADWVLAGELTDDKLREVHQILSKAPTTEYEKYVYRQYALRDGRIYRITARGLQWVVPRGMRHQIVRTAHDDLGHFATEKTLQRLCKQYWFPRMRQYVDRYIACCIPCLYGKRNGGRQEGFLHLAKVPAEPINILHIDHLGPFPKSRKGHMYILAGMDAFTKFVFLRAVRTTEAKYVIDYFKDIFATYRTPKTLISDRGSCFTSRRFQDFCMQNDIRHIMSAVSTPRANGQVERLNRTLLSALLTTVTDESRWNECVRAVQFAINNTPNRTTGKTPSLLLFGFEPRQGVDASLRDEVSTAPRIISDLFDIRQNAARRNSEERKKGKAYFDRRRKRPREYREGDLVLTEQHSVSTGSSRKLQAHYAGPMIVKKVLLHGRYVLAWPDHMQGKRGRSTHEKIVAVDQMKPWCPTGGISDCTEGQSGEDDTVLSDNTE